MAWNDIGLFLIASIIEQFEITDDLKPCLNPVSGFRRIIARSEYPWKFTDTRLPFNADLDLDRV